MTDILQDMADILAKIEDGDPQDLTQKELYLLLSRAVGEIDRLRRVNSDMGWRLNPDRMGGQFTQEEIDRSTRGGEGWWKNQFKLFLRQCFLLWEQAQ
jgi:hypothetical protein